MRGMPDDEIPDHHALQVIRELVIYAIYGYTAYCFLDDLTDGTISLWITNKWYSIREDYRREIAIRKQVGSVIFQAMEAIEHEG